MVLRQLPLALGRDETTRVEVIVGREAASYLNNARRRDVAAVEEKFGKPVTITLDDRLLGDAFRVVCVDKSGNSADWTPPSGAAG
jgi:Ribonuclease G/E